MALYLGNWHFSATTRWGSNTMMTLATKNLPSHYQKLSETLIHWHQSSSPRSFPLPDSGMVFCSTSHKLHEVILPKLSAIIVLAGEKHVYLADKHRVFKAGDIFCLPPAIPCTVENRIDMYAGYYLTLFLGFDQEITSRCLSFIPRPAAPRPQAKALGLNIDQTMGKALANLLAPAFMLPDAPNLGNLTIESLCTLFFWKNPDIINLCDTAQSLANRIHLMVSARPAHKWTAEEMAARLALSERSLRRHLQMENTNIRHILLAARLNTALGLLQSRAGNVGEVAGRCGYDSPSRFAAAFKQYFGISPAQVLRNNADLPCTSKQP